MSENWEIYRVGIDGQSAFIFFNDGVSETINELALPNLLKLQVAFRNAAESGMAGEGELATLDVIDDEIESWAADTGAAYVGRVTCAGCRTYFCYTDYCQEDAEALAEHLILQSGYEIGISLDADPDKQVYWDAIYPAPQERQVMSDMQVIKQLEAYNDNLSAPRRIDHFAYFDSRVQIEMFVNWARKHGFMIDQMAKPSADVPQHMVVFHHDCRPLPEEISSHTFAVAANANRLGGEYGGWTTTAQSQTY